jgi:hypothetical protein
MKTVPAPCGTRGHGIKDGHNMNSYGTKRVRSAKHISDLRFLSQNNPILAITMAVVFFSNAGIPPLAGFYGKLNVFLAAVEESMYFLALMGIICSVIGAFYSIRLVKIIYFHIIFFPLSIMNIYPYPLRCTKFMSIRQHKLPRQQRKDFVSEHRNPPSGPKPKVRPFRPRFALLAQSGGTERDRRSQTFRWIARSVVSEGRRTGQNDLACA